MRSLRRSSLLVVALTAACGSGGDATETVSTVPAVTDGSVWSPSEAGDAPLYTPPSEAGDAPATDAGQDAKDAGKDAPSDRGDASEDASDDVTSDASEDATSDATEDATSDGATGDASDDGTSDAGDGGCGATNLVTSCGTCGHVCPGWQATGTYVTCDSSQTCTFACQGEAFDVDGDVANGCEVDSGSKGIHTQATAASVGSLTCNDGSSNPNISGELPSDGRVHEQPGIVGFDSGTGSAPDWFSIAASGGTFCQDDISLSLTMTKTQLPTCYKLTVTTDKQTLTAVTAANGTANVSAGSGAYSDGSTIYVLVEKVCSAGQPDDATFTVTGHL